MSVDKLKVFKGILTKLGIKAADLAVLDAEEMPEDWEQDEFVAAQAKKVAGVQIALAQKSEAWQQAEQAKLDEAIKKQFAAIQKPVLNRLKKEGLSDEDMKDKSISELFDLAKVHYEKQAEGAKGDENAAIAKLKQDLDHWKQQSQGYQDERDALKGQIQEVRDESDAKMVDFTSKFQVKQYFATEAFDGLEWDNPSKDGVYKDYIRRQLEDRYQVKPDKSKPSGLVLLDKDGTAATSLDGTGIYEEPREAIEALARENRLLKMSNGGSGNPGSKVSRMIPNNGKDYDMGVQSARAKAWAARAAENQ